MGIRKQHQNTHSDKSGNMVLHHTPQLVVGILIGKKKWSENISEHAAGLLTSGGLFYLTLLKQMSPGCD